MSPPFRFLVLAIPLFASLATWSHAAEAQRLPNIVIILSDDYGYGSANCYGADPKFVRTPNIDRLAREGIRFTDANTPSSVCTPTRYGLMTGRYCWRTSLKREVLGVSEPLLIEPTRLTIASLLKRHGYNTAAVGKWHLGYGNDRPVDFTARLRPGPKDVGFDYHFAVPANHGDNTGIFIENDAVVGLRSNKLTPFGQCYYGGRPFMGIDAPQRTDENVMDVLTDKVVKWLEQQDAKTPFFLYYTPVAIHEPATPSARTEGSSVCGDYGDWIHELDISVGKVLEALDRRNLVENTLVIFTSDNGGVVISTGGTRPEAKAYDVGFRCCGALRGRKHSVFEGGFRVPFVVRWPGKAPAGTVCNATINLVDMIATINDIVGDKLPARSQGAEDSYSVLPTFLGHKLDRPLRPDMIVHSADGNFAIRQGPWKWIEGKYHPDTKPGAVKARAAEFSPQLYNLQDDPAETKNVIAQHPDVAKRLSELLKTYREQGFSRP